MSGRPSLLMRLPCRGACLLLAVCARYGVTVEALRASADRPRATAARGTRGVGKDIRHRQAASLRSQTTTAAPAKPEPGVHFLRIQKTGSSSLQELIVQFCPSSSACDVGMHRDWVEATQNGTYKGPVVTLLRDPVERAISEFLFLRGNDGKLSSVQPQWDFRNPSWLTRIRDENISKALHSFITGYPKNPSRNRQTLYILGFRRRADNAEPGKVYDWDSHPGALVNRAMGKLENLTAFGITDCWESSVRAIAKALHWDLRRLRKLAVPHGREWSNHHDKELLEKWLGKRIPEDKPWADVIPGEYIKAIREWSGVDVLLYRKARARFTEKFGEPC